MTVHGFIFYHCISTSVLLVSLPAASFSAASPAASFRYLLPTLLSNHFRSTNTSLKCSRSNWRDERKREEENCLYICHKFLKSFRTSNAFRIIKLGPCHPPSGLFLSPMPLPPMLPLLPILPLLPMLPLLPISPLLPILPSLL